MKAHRSSFETANIFTQNPRNGSEQNMTECSTDTAATKTTTKSPAITSREEADQTSIMAELKEQRKQNQLALDQNTKLMECW